MTNSLWSNGRSAPVNPFGSGWWGLSDTLPHNAEFARKTGYQISAVKGMLDRLATGYIPGGTPDTFGTPQSFLSEDGTANSVELVWQPNNAASGYNIYRAPTSTGPFTKINSQLVTGASFVDAQLQANSTNQYQIKAVDQNGIESQPTSPVIGVTAADPPACDPYYSDNVTHVIKLRAFADVLDNTWAIGSLEWMGRFGTDEYSHLIKQSPLYYDVGYCP